MLYLIKTRHFFKMAGFGCAGKAQVCYRDLLIK
jgi:hypothetical protein